MSDIRSIAVDNGPLGFIDRFLGAILAFVLVAITLILAPVAIATQIHQPHPFTYYFTVNNIIRIYSTPFFLWVGFVSFLSIFYGAYCGTMGVIIRLSHIWGTSSDEDEIGRSWAFLIVCGLITYGFFFWTVSLK